VSVRASTSPPDLPAAPARGPAQLGARAWPPTLRRTWHQFQDDHLLQWAAALAFFAAVSIFPALLALVALLGIVGSSAVQPLIENVGQLAPGTARDVALSALQTIEAHSERAGTTFAVSLAVALWSASGYVGAFIPAANVVWEVQEARPFWKRVAVRLALTLVLLVATAMTALAVVLTGPIAQQVGNVVGLGDAAVSVWGVAKWPFLALVVMLLLAVLYWASPNVQHPGWRWITPGSALAVLVWIVASLAFTFYVAHFGDYSAVYGSVGGVLVFLLWLWVTNVAFLLGAEFDAELARTRAIDAGMRPKDRTPFLPLRDRPAK
jgi:membrane protein